MRPIFCLERSPTGGVEANSRSTSAERAAICAGSCPLTRCLASASRRNSSRRSVRHDRDAPDVVILPPVLVAGTTLVGFAIHRFLWSAPVLPWSLASRVAGAILLIAAGILSHLAHAAMKRVGTNVLPTQPTLALATDGPYRFTRNPFYVAAIGVYLALSLLLNSAAMMLLALPMAAILHWGVVLREERYLESKFGSSYLAYRNRVRRWL